PFSLLLQRTDLAVRVAVVVRADLRAISLLAVCVFVELGRVLDLVLGSVDDNGLRIEIDSLDHGGRKHDLLAEDPRAGVHHDVARADIVGPFVDFPDPAVGRFDLEADQVDSARHVDAKRVDITVGPWFGCRVRTFHLSPPRFGWGSEVQPRSVYAYPDTTPLHHRVERLVAVGSKEGAGGAPDA